MESKICRICKEEKPLTEFHKGKGYRDGYQNQCRTCKYLRHDKYSSKASKFCTTRAHIVELLTSNVTCQICGTGERRLVIDHDHDTMKIRGVLCHICNTGIGAFKDNPGLIQKAINYLENHNGS
jgi:Recombination endonuclease VII